MTTSHHHTASGRPLRVSPAWVGAADNASHDHHVLPVREAVWIWSVRRYCRLALWALPAAAALNGWSALRLGAPPGPLVAQMVAGWLSAVGLMALAGLLAGSHTRKFALAGLLVGLAGLMIRISPVILTPGTKSLALTPLQLYAVSLLATAATAAGWLLTGWALFRCRLVNPADGILLMLAATAIGAGSHASQPLPTVGALLLLAAGTGIAWTGHRLLPRH